jgi:bacterioferritin
MTNDAKHNGSAVTSGDRADRHTVIRLLNGALATEIVCVLRYQRHHLTARRLHAKAVALEFLAYANEEQRHADLIAARITQLGGTLIFSPDGLFTFDHSEYAERKDLFEMIREDLMAERNCIETYDEMIRYFGNDDPTSRRLLEEILVNEEQHAGELTALIDILRREERGAFFFALDPRPRRTPARPRELGADRPRRVDSYIEYFGVGDARRTTVSSDACGEALLDGDGVPRAT